MKDLEINLRYISEAVQYLQNKGIFDVNSFYTASGGWNNI